MTMASLSQAARVAGESIVLSNLLGGGGGGGTGVLFFGGLISDFSARYLIFCERLIFSTKEYYSGIGTSNCINFDHNTTMSTVADMIDIVIAYGVYYR